MKVKNGHILVSTQFLSGVNSAEHSIRFAFHVSTIVNRVNAAVKIIEELRQKIIAETHDKDAEGNLLYHDADKRFAKLTDAGNKKLAELMELESDIEFEQFTLEQLEAASVKIAPANVEVLRWLIK